MGELVVKRAKNSCEKFMIMFRNIWEIITTQTVNNTEIVSEQLRNGYKTLVKLLLKQVETRCGKYLKQL